MANDEKMRYGANRDNFLRKMSSEYEKKLVESKKFAR